MQNKLLLRLLSLNKASPLKQREYWLGAAVLVVVGWLAWSLYNQNTTVETYLLNMTEDRIYLRISPEVITDLPSTLFVSNFKDSIKSIECTKPSGTPLSVTCQVAFMSSQAKPKKTVTFPVQAKPVFMSFPDKFKFEQNESCVSNKCEYHSRINTPLKPEGLTPIDTYWGLINTLNDAGLAAMPNVNKPSPGRAVLWKQS